MRLWDGFEKNKRIGGEDWNNFCVIVGIKDGNILEAYEIMKHHDNIFMFLIPKICTIFTGKQYLRDASTKTHAFKELVERQSSH